MPSSTSVWPFQPTSMSPAQLAAVSYLARYSGATHALYKSQLRRWFGWWKRETATRIRVIQT